MLVSIVVTLKNEERHIRDLMDSLVVQEKPVELIFIDAYSSDGTMNILKSYKEKYDFIHIYQHGGTRGEGRNFGAEKGNGGMVAFIDGDCIANPFWAKEIRQSMMEADIVAGKTIDLGYQPFVELERVELYCMGTDVTYPSCNLAYKRDVFFSVKGFDAWFRTAEDIDLNYRAVESGYTLKYNENAIVYHRARGTVKGFVKQALWNGYGRKQLTLKHGTMWKHYSFENMFKTNITFWSLIRLIFALMGYLMCSIFESGKERE